MLDRIFGADGLLYRGLNRLIDLLILNLIFLVTCLPVFTIGAAVTALYGVTRNMTKDEGYIVSGYMKAFKEAFWKSTIVWLIMGAVLVVIAADFWILSGGGLEIGDWARGIMLSVLVLWFIIFTYVFPLISKFENTIKNTMMNACIISMTRIGYTVPAVALNMLPFFLLFIGGRFLLYGISVYICVGFSVTAYVNTYIFEHVFKKYIRD